MTWDAFVAKWSGSCSMTLNIRSVKDTDWGNVAVINCSAALLLFVFTSGSHADVDDAITEATAYADTMLTAMLPSE